MIRRLDVAYMNDLKVECAYSVYDVYIENDMDNLYKAFERNNIKNTDKIFIITDSKVYKLYLSFIKGMELKYNCKVYFFHEGEEYKNFNTVQGIYNFLIENNGNRDSILIAIGGGVVGDIVGYVASTFMRGIRYIGIPTTLISQVDSCIGGKVGYNYKELKNIIGSFYNPMFVYINIGFLKTLEDEDYLSGLGEVIKYGLIRENTLISLIEENYQQLLNRESTMLLFIIRECLGSKSEIIADDFKDLGVRNVLNFGHTAAHGLEVCSNYKLPHGIAVALGMLVAIRISEEKLDLSTKVYSRIENIYNKLGFITKYKIDNFDLFLYAINRDKKNDNAIRFVLLEALGKCKIKAHVNNKEIINALKNSICRED